MAAAITIRQGIAAHTSSATMPWRKSGARSAPRRLLQIERSIAMNTPPANNVHMPKTTTRIIPLRPHLLACDTLLPNKASRRRPGWETLPRRFAPFTRRKFVCIRNISGRKINRLNIWAGICRDSPHQALAMRLECQTQPLRSACDGSGICLPPRSA